MDWYQVVCTADHGGRTIDDLAIGGSCWVDVRDLAEAHAMALEQEQAGGERIIVSAGR
jgi:nucleoside-diphosphate-sugar epimerase